MPGPVPVSIDIGRIRDPGGKEPFLDIQAPAVPDPGTLSRVTKVIDMAYRDRKPGAGRCGIGMDKDQVSVAIIGIAVSGPASCSW